MTKTYTERDARDWQLAIDEKDAEIARLREQLGGANHMVETLREAERIERIKNTRLRAALGPFAAHAVSFAGGHGRFTFHDSYIIVQSQQGPITVGHLRAALSALEDK